MRASFADMVQSELRSAERQKQSKFFFNERMRTDSSSFEESKQSYGDSSCNEELNHLDLGQVDLTENVLGGMQSAQYQFLGSFP